MTHACSFELDKDGQITCLICGARDDKKAYWLIDTDATNV